ncbi:hypothetical protein KC336_g21 [Hortaea werneckii]|nr:hypothetical protein KC336_g21 [Hortaea werneckii]
MGRNFHLSSFHPGLSAFPPIFANRSGEPASSDGSNVDLPPARNRRHSSKSGLSCRWTANLSSNSVAPVRRTIKVSCFSME